ncbi:MAG: hypothetical protein K2Z81_25550 [Cyanobacteria bacterium]|nr:hypothetical protein [Cyanobacteriota bacterium]
MILSNVKMWEALDDGRVQITPEPERTVGSGKPYDAAGVNLRLNNVIQVPPHRTMWAGFADVIIDVLWGLLVALGVRQWHQRRWFVAPTCYPDKPRDHLTLCRTVTLKEGEVYPLRPGELILAQTAEVVEIADTRKLSFGTKPMLTCKVEGKSSLGRSGVTVHITAPNVWPGSRHKITLEIKNLGPWVVNLTPGMLVCVLQFEEMDGDPVPHVSQFNGQESPNGEKH